MHRAASPAKDSDAFLAAMQEAAAIAERHGRKWLQHSQPEVCLSITPPSLHLIGLLSS